MDHPAYSEKQFAKLLWVILPAVSVFLTAMRYHTAYKEAPLTASGIILVVNVVLLLLFGQLTISVDKTYLRWHFGFLGWPCWKLALANITEVEVSSSTWLEGWGIKYTRQGMLYNVSGTSTVRVHKRDGKSFRLGCADPQRLASFLKTRLPAEGQR